MQTQEEVEVLVDVQYGDGGDSEVSDQEAEMQNLPLVAGPTQQFPIAQPRLYVLFKMMVFIQLYSPPKFS